MDPLETIISGTEDYGTVLATIKQEILHRQAALGKIVNTSLLELYRKIGQFLSLQQKTWWRGKGAVEQLSKDILTEFPWIKWFSIQNLRYMKSFYETYINKKRLQPLVGEISWSNHIVIMDKCDNDFEREFYIKLCVKQACSKRILMNKIDNKEYERYMIAHKDNNFALIEAADLHESTTNILKDSYIFDFLTLGKKYSERELEENLVGKVKDFMLELWLWFAYMGSQYQIIVDRESYFLDLLFYHTKLQCYVVIELKIGAFKPEYAGKLSFYTTALDRILKSEHDSPTIGLLLCKEKKQSTVEIALHSIRSPLAVSKYTFDNDEIGELKAYLPDPQKLQDILNEFDQ